MARINIEDLLFSDTRFIELAMKTGDPSKALGDLIFVWKCAQKYWLDSKNGIPKSVWINRKFSNLIISCGLAVDHGDFIYVCGSNDQFKWITKCQDSGKKKAKKSDNFRDIIEKNGKALTLPLTLTLNTNNNTIVQFSNEIEQLYLGYPRKEGKTLGIKTLVKKIKTNKDLEMLNKCFSNYIEKIKREKTEKRFIKLFSTFANSYLDYEIDETTLEQEILIKKEKEVAASFALQKEMMLKNG